MDEFIKYVSLGSNLLTIVVSSMAIILFWVNRQQISSAFKLLLNFAFRVTLSELNAKMERLNDLSANDPVRRDEVLNIFNEIAGQMRGNKVLSAKCKNLIVRIGKHADGVIEITEPRKRALISELRETLRHVDLEAQD